MNQDIIEYLIINQDHIKDLIKFDTIAYTNYIQQEDSIWSSMIKDCYIENIKSIIINDVAKNLGTDYVSIMEVLDDIVIEEYIK